MTRRFGLVCGTVAALAVTVACWTLAQAEEAKPARRVAFLVGINHYLKPGFRDLSYAEQDVRDVAGELRKQNFEVTVLTGSSDGTDKATRQNIVDRVQRLVAPLEKKDLMLVMLSGHGEQIPVTTEGGGSKEDAFFCPVDAVHNDASTLFSISYLIDKILDPNVGRKLVLLDACRDQPKDPSRGAKGIQGRVIALPEDTAVLFSCRAGQESYEIDELKHGLFTSCVLESLRDGAGAQEGELSWDDLVAHVSHRMATPQVQKLLPAQRRQTPISAGGVEHTVLARITAPKPQEPASAPAGTLVGSRAGEIRDDNGLGTKLVWIPPGDFTMGSPKDEKGRSADGRENQVQVTLTKGFWLGQHEVTQAEWQHVMRTTPWGGQKYVKEGDDYPATFVSWDDAIKFCEKLTETERDAGRLPTGWKYTLPTEAQWEYACRAGTKTRFSFGNDDSDLNDYGWSGGFVGGGNVQNDLYAHQVGQKKPNPWGLSDMHGNVWEWCRDVYAEKLPGGDDPEVSAGGSSRVDRGGGWDWNAVHCRAAFRLGYSPGIRLNDLGFRLARVPLGK